MNRYSRTSLARLDTAHPDLQLVFETVLDFFDHTILCGHRGEAEQNRAFQERRSKVQWPNGKHNKVPSQAVDAIPYSNPLDWTDRERMTLFAGHVLAVAQMLYAAGKITHLVRWGGDWDKDTEVADNGFDDLVHFELYKP